MKRIRYTKFTGDLSSSFGLEDLMEALSDFLLDSGFNDPYSQFQEYNDQTLENLREAIRQALESGELFDEESQEKFEQLNADQVEELIDLTFVELFEQRRRSPQTAASARVIVAAALSAEGGRARARGAPLDK